MIPKLTSKCEDSELVRAVQQLEVVLGLMGWDKFNVTRRKMNARKCYLGTEYLTDATEESLTWYLTVLTRKKIGNQ